MQSNLFSDLNIIPSQLVSLYETLSQSQCAYMSIFSSETKQFFSSLLCDHVTPSCSFRLAPYILSLRKLRDECRSVPVLFISKRISSH